MPGSESHYIVRLFFLTILAMISVQRAFASTAGPETPAAPEPSLAQEAAQHGDLEVAVNLDATEQSGSATATVRIHARRELVWGLITSCAEAVLLVPGLVRCEVLQTAPDGSWQNIRHVLDYSWYVPKLTYEIHASYQPPARVSIERTSGDLRVLKGSWDLQSDGDYTIAHYAVALAPGFWVPRWIERVALKRDLPKMLRALRSRAELKQSQKPG